LTLYPNLRETSDSDPRQRTEWNVCDSDRLLVLVDGARLQASKGTVFAVECAVRFGKPHVVINLDDEGAVARGQSFPRRGALALNVGGPRESEAPGIYTKAGAFLRIVLAQA